MSKQHLRLPLILLFTMFATMMLTGKSPEAFAETNALEAPTGLMVDAIRETSVTLSWHPMDEPVTAYVVYVFGQAYETTSSTTLTITGLKRATDYDMAIAAQDMAGNLSPMSEPVTVTTDGVNLLENGSFDLQSEETGLAEGWLYDGEGMSLITNPVSDGTWSHRIAADDLKKGRYIALYQRVWVKPEKTYVFEGDFLIKKINGAKVQLYLDFFDSQDRWVGENSKSLTSPTDGSFVSLSAEGVVPKDASYAFALVKVQAVEEGGSALLVADRLWMRYGDVYFTESYEPNNYMTNAYPIKPGSYSSFLSVPGDQDWFQLKSDSHAVYDISLKVPKQLDADIEVRSGSGKLLGHSTKGRGVNEKLTVNVNKGQDMFIKIAGAYAEDYDKEPYVLTVTERKESAGPGGTDSAPESFVRFDAVQTEDRLRFSISGEGLQARHTIFLDTDNNRSTGMLSSKWPQAGIDYKIEHNKLYKYNAGSPEWTEAGYVSAEISRTSAVFEFYKADAAVTRGASVRAGYEGGDGAIYPQIGEELKEVRLEKAERNPNAFYPKELFGPINNPFMGWAPSSRGGNYQQPFSLVTASITWRDLEPSKGLFDWEGVDRKYDLSYWSDRGKRVVLRLVTDVPTADPAHMDIPDWLYEELIAEEGAGKAGTWYKSPSGSGFSPNYESESFIREHKRMIAEAAKKWDHDPRIAFVQIGSLGHHGEFHSSLIDWFPPVSVSDQYIQHYISSFQHKELAIRKPFPIAASSAMGLYNDMFGETGSTAVWLKWTQEGWYGIRSYVAPQDNPEEMQRKSRMPDFWKTGYSAGEFSSNRDVKEYVGDELMMDSMDQLRESHTSWLGATSLSSLKAGSGLTDGQQANADLLLSMMGYRFVLESVERTQETDGSIGFSMNWINKGAAPFYYDWKLQLALIDEEGNIVESTRTNVQTDLRDWLPGKHTVEARVTIPQTLPKGDYRLAVAVIDPDTGRPGLSLAIQGKRSDGWYPLNPITN